uniref:Uncharacterized protein n=1 Tax=Haptolina ericina TaxID=156174 RepID=A0A7S3AXQ3_9EUKA
MTSTMDFAHHSHNVNEESTILLNSCICGNQALYLDCPKCIGCSGKYEFCCFQEAFCCTAGTDCMWCSAPEGQGICFQLGLGCCACACRMPRVCCKGQGHCCCCVDSYACPTDREVPCAITILGLTCCFRWGPRFACCNTQRQLRARGGPEPPSCETMSR